MAGGGEGVDPQVVLWKQPHRQGDGSAEHPAGEIKLGRRSLIVARASALAGTVMLLTTALGDIEKCPLHTSTPI